jgi:hypothetical protein
MRAFEVQVEDAGFIQFGVVESLGAVDLDAEIEAELPGFHLQPLPPGRRLTAKAPAAPSFEAGIPTTLFRSS